MKTTETLKIFFIMLLCQLYNQFYAIYKLVLLSFCIRLGLDYVSVILTHGAYAVVVALGVKIDRLRHWLCHP